MLVRRRGAGREMPVTMPASHLPVVLATGALGIFATVLIYLANESGEPRLGGPILVTPAPGALISARVPVTAETEGAGHAAATR